MVNECAEEEYVPDSQGPGSPEDEGSDPSAHEPSSGEEQSQEQEKRFDWPTRDPEGSATPATGDAADPVERTRLIGRVELGRESEPAAGTSGVGDDTARIGEAPRPGTSEDAAPEASVTDAVTDPGTGSSGPPFDPGPETMRIAPIRQTPSSDPPPVEQPTQQFSVSEVIGPPAEMPRPARADDFTPRADGFTARPEPSTQQETARPEPARPADRDPGQDVPEPQPAGETDPDPVSAPTDRTDRTGEQPPARSRSKRRPLIAVALAAVVVLGAGAVFGWPVLTGSPGHPKPPAPVRLSSTVEPLGESAPVPTGQGLASALAPIVSDPALGTLGGIVRDAATGRTLWAQQAGRPLVPASTAKLLTTGAALLALDHDFRFHTKVVRGSEPGSVVLVGGGDPTLSGLPKGEKTVYPGAARLGELVAQVEKATGEPVTSVKVDVSRYTGPKLAPGWLKVDVANGYVAPIEPVMLSGGRNDPTEGSSPRSYTPALDVGRELAARLGVPESAVSIGRAPEGAKVLGEVRSATLVRMVRTTLLHSDNVLAEALARQVAITTGHEPSFAGSAEAVRDVLREHGFDLGGTTIVDGSGLSVLDRVTPKLLVSLLGAAGAINPDGAPSQRTAELRPLLSGLPVAGGSGSLAGRYHGAASEGRGWVRAKTGTLTDVNSLAGTVLTEDGRLLVFAFISNGTSSTVARPALDRIAATLRGCGCR